MLVCLLIKKREREEEREGERERERERERYIEKENLRQFDFTIFVKNVVSFAF